MNKTYDIAIIGGGLAGLSLACLLGRHGLKIACIDAADPKIKPKDLRTTAVSFGSRKVLEKAGIWENISENCPINDIQILDGSSPVLLEFLSGEVENKVFGWIVDNHHLKIAMIKRLKALKNVTHIAPAKVADFEIHDTHANVHLEGGKIFEAQLIIGADGRFSSVREFMTRHYGLQTRQWSYNQRAVICTVAHENPHNNIAVEHFWPEGPFAILPFADDKDGTHRSSVVFTQHGPEKNSAMHMSDEEFEAALAARFPSTYGDVKLIGRRAAYPLGLVHARDYIAPRMVLVADAAHGIHPIAGQGLNLGFRDLDTLDELIGQAHKAGEDIAAPKLLETYQRRRRPDNMAMVAMTDGLNRLFSNNIMPMRILRRSGLKLVSRLRPAKNFFMKQAMGDR
ncbi:MAG: UbiH/UbiF/VisC/COQ6 family ubiquinone biosynthesis hydroxylase [Alphaproteobacteria bacterium]